MHTSAIALRQRSSSMPCASVKSPETAASITHLAPRPRLSWRSLHNPLRHRVWCASGQQRRWRSSLLTLRCRSRDQRRPLAGQDRPNSRTVQQFTARFHSICRIAWQANAMKPHITVRCRIVSLAVWRVWPATARTLRVESLHRSVRPPAAPMPQKRLGPPGPVQCSQAVGGH